MVSRKKVQTAKEVREEIKKYPVIGLVDMFKLPARQLHDIRNKIRDRARIRMVKKRIIKLILEENKDLRPLVDHMQGEPALIFTEMDSFRLARIIDESKSMAAAKAGDVAPCDIEVKAGPTPLAPGPVIGELQRAKIPAVVEGEKISIRKDTVVAKKGETINKSLADILLKLGIEPIEIGLNLVAVWEGGTVYGKDVLSITPADYERDIKQAHTSAFNLSLSIGYLTPDNLPLLISKAHREAVSLALATNTVVDETLGTAMARAHRQAELIKNKVKLGTDESPQELEGGEDENES